MESTLDARQAGKNGTTDANVAVLDTTLRDGAYAVNFQFERGFVEALLRGIDQAGLPFVELGHGVGVEAERAGYPSCNIDVATWCQIANEQLSEIEWGVFAQPAFTRLSTLQWMCRQGMSFVRVGMEPHKVDRDALKKLRDTPVHETPGQDGGQQDAGEYDAVSGSPREEVLDLVRRLTGTEDAVDTDNFFDIGGDSASALILLNKLKELGWSSVGVRDVIRAQTLDDLIQGVMATKETT